MQISQSSISSSANVWSLPLNNLIDYSHYFWVIFPFNYQLELIFVLRESPPLTGISHDKHTFYTHNSLQPLPNYLLTKSYNQAATWSNDMISSSLS